MSLRLLKGLPLQDYPSARVGIMAHANTTQNFQQAFRQYPCDNFEFCDAVGGPCEHQEDILSCPVRERIVNRTVKMCDSGIFTREGATLSYDLLFRAYAEMDVKYGVMIDVFQDPKATLESGKEALQAYEPYKGTFKLVGVAHGDTVEEYLNSYAQLKQLGFEHVAVGGLLRRRINAVRFAYVRSESFILQVLRRLREEYPDDWLFALGCFHPSRLPHFKELTVWADYKGWIFQYEKRNETLAPQLETLAANHLEHIDSQDNSQSVAALRHLIAKRNRAADRQRKIRQKLINGRRRLRAALASLYAGLQQEMPEIAVKLKVMSTHGLLDDTEERLVGEALRSLRMQDSKDAAQILENVSENRKLQAQLKQIEAQVNKLNNQVAAGITALQESGTPLSEDTKNSLDYIVGLTMTTERDHRFTQVRSKIAQAIMAVL